MTQSFVIWYNATLGTFEFRPEASGSDFGFTSVPLMLTMNKNVFSVHCLFDVTGSCFHLTPYILLKPKTIKKV
jgi:hypothetical protein